MRNLTATLCLTLTVLMGCAVDYATALRELTPLAEQGDASAQHNLGVMYRYGRGVPQDFATAMKWYTLAAEQGHAFAQYNLGWMYAEGLGVPQDYKTAAKWYTLAAEQGDATAQYNLGRMYETGRGVPQDDKTAVKWWTLAAEQGDDYAQKQVEILEAKIAARQRRLAQLGVPDPADEREPPPVAPQPPPVAPQPQVADEPAPPSELFAVSSGTGFFVSKDGYIVTNQHVIDGCLSVTVHRGGVELESTIVSSDRQNDLALLKIEFAPSDPLSFSPSNGFLSQDIFVFGFPFGDTFSSTIKVTAGIISSLTGIGNNFSEIQIDAALQPGNSGGPIVDEFGNVVGVAVAKLDALLLIEKMGVIPENTNFGIKANVVKAFLQGNFVAYRTGVEATISRSDLAAKVSNNTLYLSCWMTMAQIEQMIERKVMFKKFR